MDHLGHLGVTRIIVAHRLSTVRQADHLVVVDRGRVVEAGPFDSLIANNGLFASLDAPAAAVRGLAAVFDRRGAPTHAIRPPHAVLLVDLRRRLKSATARAARSTRCGSPKAATEIFRTPRS